MLLIPFCMSASFILCVTALLTALTYDDCCIGLKELDKNWNSIYLHVMIPYVTTSSDRLLMLTGV
jgi:hypothetical protein